ncbi:MAG: Nif3-like dinuclear metal center hexameric protein [Myxococcota bacterium]|jgi:dinuclear metal center YbgI/SA1388 family protein|nr:Nif3-like dinuclear metal center hexameric protein [Myxococcota bacterium]
MQREELERYLDETLQARDFDDSSLNGLQVEGAAEIHRVALAVSACAAAFRQAVAVGAQALIVHHGLLWRSTPPAPIRGMLAARLRLLLGNDLNLFAYHLPLDAHPELGHSAVALRYLGGELLQPFGLYHGRAIGWRATLPRAVARGDFVARLEQYYEHPAILVPGGPPMIRTVGLLSGGAAREAEQAADLGLDLYVTGEASEPTTYLCRERGLNFAALGHYATERVGIKALAERLQQELGLEVRYLELENPA